MRKDILANGCKELIEYLEQNNYNVAYISQLKKEIASLCDALQNQSVESYEDYMRIVEQSVTEKQFVVRRQMVGKIKQFVEEGIYPSKQHPFCIGKTNFYADLSPQLREVADAYTTWLERQKLADTTIKSRKGVFTKFLYHLHCHGINDMESVTEDMVQSYFYDGTTVIRGSDVIKNIRQGIDHAEVDVESACHIRSFLPQIKKVHKLYHYLDDEENKSLLQLMHEDGDIISFRNKAILILLYYTGIRGGDLASMTLDDIDWKNGQITFVQNKTGVKNTLPLRPVVGNALFDYITNERPKTDGRIIFLTNDRNPRKLSSGTIYDIIDKVFAKIDLRQSGERKGTHLFRHNLTRQLIKSNTSAPLVTEILGHNSPESLDSYLESDIEALKRCSLSIERFMVGKEVFKL